MARSIGSVAASATGTASAASSPQASRRVRVRSCSAGPCASPEVGVWTASGSRSAGAPSLERPTQGSDTATAGTSGLRRSMRSRRGRRRAPGPATRARCRPGRCPLQHRVDEILGLVLGFRVHHGEQHFAARLGDAVFPAPAQHLARGKHEQEGRGRQRKKRRSATMGIVTSAPCSSKRRISQATTNAWNIQATTLTTKSSRPNNCARLACPDTQPRPRAAVRCT